MSNSDPPCGYGIESRVVVGTGTVRHVVSGTTRSSRETKTLARDVDVIRAALPAEIAGVGRSPPTSPWPDDSQSICHTQSGRAIVGATMKVTSGNRCFVISINLDRFRLPSNTRGLSPRRGVQISSVAAFANI